MSDYVNATFALPGDALSQARRSAMEMVCDILNVLVEGPTKPTHILYKANMSWKVLSAYLEYLIGRGLVEREDQGGKRSVYKITQKGDSIVKLYQGLRVSLEGKGGEENGRELVGLLGHSVTVESRRSFVSG